MTIKGKTKTRFLTYTGCSRNAISQDEGINALMNEIDRLRGENAELVNERTNMISSYNELHVKHEKLQEEHIELLRKTNT